MNRYKSHTILRRDAGHQQELITDSSNTQQLQADPQTDHHLSFNITEILTHGVIVLHQLPSEIASLDLPEAYWSQEHSLDDLPANILELINEELSCC